MVKTNICLAYQYSLFSFTFAIPQGISNQTKTRNPHTIGGKNIEHMICRMIKAIAPWRLRAI